MSEELACYAVTESCSRGRCFPEPPHAYRSDFERDRDRIIHCSAFRRLEGKTQVFTPGLDDYYRTRLTHSIEVAQIGRTIAKALALNESLTESICLAHDLGHPPFGHSGEAVLNELLSDFGGFEHNAQTLRTVDLLEHPYPDFPGLNLMYETRLGLARHRTSYDAPEAKQFEQLNCSLEGQAANVADRIAYNCHDLEDGLRAGLLSTERLDKVTLFVKASRRIRANAIDDTLIRRTRIAKAIIDMLVSDCIDTSREVIARAQIKTVDEVYATRENLVRLSCDSDTELAGLEKFLFENLYRHDLMVQTARKVEGWLKELFEGLCAEPDLMPGYFRRLAKQQGLERTVCDYIAGMTDRFCLKMLERF